MYRQNRITLIAVVIALTFFLTQYQNCAPVKVDQNDKGGPPPISTIDDVNRTTAVSFSEKQIALNDSLEHFDVAGVCDKAQSGAILGWVLEDVAGNRVQAGRVQCVDGQFQIGLDLLQDLDCNQAHTLVAYLGVGDEGEVIITRRCLAASKVVAESEPSEECYFELGTEESPQCQRVCYSSGKVLSVESALAEQCGG